MKPTAISSSIASRTALAMVPVTSIDSMRCRTTRPINPTIIVPDITAIPWREIAPQPDHEKREQEPDGDRDRGVVDEFWRQHEGIGGVGWRRLYRMADRRPCPAPLSRRPP